MRLIDADALRMEDFRHCLDCDSIIQVIKYAPTIDAVPVVRCKDCKRCYKHTTKRYKQPMWICMRLDLDSFAVRPDDFCSYGERKDGEG